MSYVGNTPISAAFLTDTFSGNGSTTAFTMSVAPANTSSVLVAVTGVVQSPDTYSVSGTTLTFSAAPPTGTSNISVRYLGIPASGVTTTAYRTITNFTATAGQTTFTPASYTVGYIDVYRNGVRLTSADFTASNGTTVVLTNAANAGDSVVTESFYVSSVLNAIPATAGSVNSTYIANGAVGTAQLADTNVTQAKLGTGVAGNGPAFSAYPNANLAISSGTFTLIQCNVEEFDTNSNFNNTGSTVGSTPAYAFLPTVAGYYQINWSTTIFSGTLITRFLSSLFKNGSEFKRGSDILGAGYQAVGSSIVYLNGSTDYVQLYGYIVGTSPQIGAGSIATYFSAALVRAA